MSNVVIIGGGIAGLATAYRLQTAAADRPPRVHLIEASPRFGGKIVTAHQDGFVIEGGPDSVIPHKPQALELIREIGLGDRLLPSNDQRRGVSVFHDGRLVALPDGLQMLVPSRWGSFLRSPLLSWPAKLRFAVEPLVPQKRSADDESVADFGRRRLGRGALPTLAEPILGHVHVGDVERMSLLATYPRLAELEARYGSLRRGASQLRARRPGAGPLFWTLRGGLAELVEALIEKLDPAALHPGCRAVRIRRGDRGWVVELDDRTLEAGAVVLATPAGPAADLVADLDPQLAASLRAIRYVSMATLSLGYRRRDVGHLDDNFGFFVPRREQSRLLAGSWTSTKFDHRAPEGHALLRLFLGGAGCEQVLDLDDEALLRGVLTDLREMLGIRAQPLLVRLTRWPLGYPQYDVGHLDLIRELEARLPPGLLLAGSAFHGVGLPDCIESGSQAASRALGHLRDV